MAQGLETRSLSWAGCQLTDWSPLALCTQKLKPMWKQPEHLSFIIAEVRSGTLHRGSLLSSLRVQRGHFILVGLSYQQVQSAPEHSIVQVGRPSPSEQKGRTSERIYIKSPGFPPHASGATWSHRCNNSDHSWRHAVCWPPLSWEEEGSVFPWRRQLRLSG